MPSPMPVRYEIDRANNLVRSTFSGVVTYEEIRSLATGIQTHPDFDPSYYEFLDLTDASDLSLDERDFDRLSKVDPFSRPSKRAFLIPTQGHIYGLTRMFQLLRGDNAIIAIFNTREKAEAWLRGSEGCTF